MKRYGFIVVVVLLLVGCSGYVDKNVQAPENWRIADKEDSYNDWARFNSPNKIVNDFNGDGKPDVAQILVKQDSIKGFNLIIQMSGQNLEKQFVLDKNEDVTPQSVSIELLEPSEKIWKSACAKGYWDCEIGEIREFKIMRPSIQFCYIESSCTVYLWSDRNSNFTKIPLSD